MQRGAANRRISVIVSALLPMFQTYDPTLIRRLASTKDVGSPSPARWWFSRSPSRRMDLTVWRCQRRNKRYAAAIPCIALPVAATARTAAREWRRFTPPLSCLTLASNPNPRTWPWSSRWHPRRLPGWITCLSLGRRNAIRHQFPALQLHAPFESSQASSRFPASPLASLFWRKSVCSEYLRVCRVRG